MTRRALAAAAILAVVIPAVPAQADHGADSYRWTERHVIVEDRSGLPRLRDAAANAAARWNATGAAITVSYRNGPVNNTCEWAGNVVPVCAVAFTHPSGEANAQAVINSESGTVTDAFIQVQPHVATFAAFNLRGILAHELAHILCCPQHSNEASILNWLWTNSRCGYECEGPTQHDIDLLRSIYGGLTTTTTTVPPTTAPPTTLPPTTLPPTTVPPTTVPPPTTLPPTTAPSGRCAVLRAQRDTLASALSAYAAYRDSALRQYDAALVGCP